MTAFVEIVERASAIPEEEYLRYCGNALAAAHTYDFKKLTENLLQVIEGI